MSDRSNLKIAVPVGETADELAITHRIGAAVRKAMVDPADDPDARFSSPTFTQELLEHLHRAKRKALNENGE